MGCNTSWKPNFSESLAPNEFMNNKNQFGLFFAAPGAKIWKRDISIASEEAFPESFGDFFVADLPQDSWCFNTQEFTRVSSTGVITALSHTVTRSDVSFQIK